MKDAITPELLKGKGFTKESFIPPDPNFNELEEVWKYNMSNNYSLNVLHSEGRYLIFLQYPSDRGFDSIPLKFSFRDWEDIENLILYITGNKP